MRKSFCVVANFDISVLDMQCAEGILSLRDRPSDADFENFGITGSEPVVAATVVELDPADQAEVVSDALCDSFPRRLLPISESPDINEIQSSRPPVSDPAARAALKNGGMSFVPAPGDTTGVETSTPLTPQERVKLAERMKPRKAKAQSHWERCCRTHSFDEVLTPLRCYKFVDPNVDVTVDPRRNDGHRAEILKILGIEPKHESMAHLSADDMACIRDLFV